MNAYFLYRINADYNGFLPRDISARARGGCISYNWRAYVESIEPGDIILTYFSGRGCRKGIFAVAEILGIRIGTNNDNVVGRVLSFSDANDRPLIDAAAHPSLFSTLRSRRRGAELVIPDHLERLVHRLLTESGAIDAQSELPGSPGDRPLSLRDVPPIHSGHLSMRLRKNAIVAAYWIRPSQATWMPRAPEWLHRITRVFRRFKAGDLSHLEVLALALAKRLIRRVECWEDVGVLVSVPLNERKHRCGEVDRVYELAKRVSRILNVPYTRSLSLKGGISRRLYKKRGLPDVQFQAYYQRHLRIRRTHPLVKCIESGRTVLLIDDVYTDGVTTQTVIDSLKREFGEGVSARVATLGIMAKTRNMNEDFSAAWRSGSESARKTGVMAPGQYESVSRTGAIPPIVASLRRRHRPHIPHG